MNKPTIWIFSLEPIETRYTKQWHAHIPLLLTEKLSDKFNIKQVDGIQKNTELTPGAFLNFSDTNYWKSSQLTVFLEQHNAGLTSKDDHIIFTDAWNPTIIQLKYMNDLLRFNWTLHGLWHAGSYDPQDFLGRIIGDKPWVRHAEQSFFHAIDHNYFATDFHIDLFAETFSETVDDEWKMTMIEQGKIVRTGWPMEYMNDTLADYCTIPKRDLILFPHRIAPEKQVEIFRDLANQLPQYEFVVCQDKKLTKDEYHTLLGQAKIVFSANLQETLGISTCAEGPLVDAIPFAPDRLSYSEIFRNHADLLYPSEWTKDWDNYMIYKNDIVNRIIHIMNNYKQLREVCRSYIDTAYNDYFSAQNLIKNIK